MLEQLARALEAVDADAVAQAMARISLANSSGSSHAAKWPPLSAWW